MGKYAPACQHYNGHPSIDAKVAREPRHHRIEPPRASHRRVEHHEDRRFLPWVGEVVDAIRDPNAVAGAETAVNGHDSGSIQ